MVYISKYSPEDVPPMVYISKYSLEDVPPMVYISKYSLKTSLPWSISPNIALRRPSHGLYLQI